MTGISQRESAKIYTFPVGGRIAAQPRRGEATPGADLRQPHVATVDYGGGWYHDTAIKDASRAPKP